MTFRQQCTFRLVALYLIVQLLVPLRHFLYPGNVSWIEEGHNFSWHMMVRSKRERTTEFFAVDPVERKAYRVVPGLVLPSWQERKMSSNPDMIREFAHFIAEEFRSRGYDQIQVQVLAEASLQGREKQLLVDPEIDLAAVERSLMPASWIMPLKDPALPAPADDRPAFMK